MLKVQKLKPNSKYQPGPLSQKLVQSQAGLSCVMLAGRGKPLPCLSPRSSALENLLYTSKSMCTISSLLLLPAFQKQGQDRKPRDSCCRGMKSSTWYIQMLIKQKPQSQGSGKRLSYNSTSQTLTREGN